jgi:hypothetical protein
MRGAGRHVLVSALTILGGCADVIVMIDPGETDDRWSVVEVRLFEGAPIAGNTVECAGLRCSEETSRSMPVFATSDTGLSVLHVGAWGDWVGTAVTLHLEPDPSYALARVVRYSDVGEPDLYPVYGWVMFEQWTDRAVAVGRFAFTADDDRWIRGTFDTRVSDD